MEIHYIPIKHTLVADAYMSTASAGIDDNDMAVSAIEKVNQPRVSAIDLVLDTSLVANPTGNVSTSKELDNECAMFKTDAIRADVASISCAYDPILFYDLLDNKIALSKFSAAVDSTTAKQQDTDCDMDI